MKSNKQGWQSKKWDISFVAAKKRELIKTANTSPAHIQCPVAVSVGNVCINIAQLLLLLLQHTPYK